MVCCVIILEGGVFFCDDKVMLASRWAEGRGLFVMIHCNSTVLLGEGRGLLNVMINYSNQAWSPQYH